MFYESFRFTYMYRRSVKFPKEISTFTPPFQGRHLFLTRRFSVRRGLTCQHLTLGWNIHSKIIGIIVSFVTFTVFTKKLKCERFNDLILLKILNLFVFSFTFFLNDAHLQCATTVVWAGWLLVLTPAIVLTVGQCLELVWASWLLALTPAIVLTVGQCLELDLS